MNSSGIYILRSPVSHKIYVGSSYNVYKRWNQHKRLLVRGKHGNKYLQNVWNKDGLTFEVLLFCEKSDLLFFEQRALDALKSYDPSFGFNFAKDAQSAMLGRQHSPATKEKMSVAQTGRVMAESTKQKIRESRIGKPTTKGRIASPETRARLSEAAKKRGGRKHSEETKAKIGSSNKGKSSVWTGKTLPEETKRKMAETRRLWWGRKKACL